MRVIRARNVHRALPLGLQMLNSYGRQSPSRYGDVIVCETPVTTVYSRPMERVLFYPERDANPFLHLFESLWMMAGRRDVKFIEQFASRMASFSDDGETFHGAYGFRWFYHFGFDQLERIENLLRYKRGSRRAILQIWDCTVDLQENEEGRDLPCNDLVHFQINDDRLDMTVFCRSNDIIWGCYGTNAVHFSVLQEYMAARLNCEIGQYWQISDNFHAYVNTLEPVAGLADLADYYKTQRVRSPYEYDEVDGETAVRWYPMVRDPATWREELLTFLENPYGTGVGRNPFFNDVARWLYMAHHAYKLKENPLRFEDAISLARHCQASDWRLACIEWLERREKAYVQRSHSPVP
jgi:hypothetical protein